MTWSLQIYMFLKRPINHLWECAGLAVSELGSKDQNAETDAIGRKGATGHHPGHSGQKRKATSWPQAEACKGLRRLSVKEKLQEMWWESLERRSYWRGLSAGHAWMRVGMGHWSQNRLLIVQAKYGASTWEHLRGLKPWNTLRVGSVTSTFGSW